MRCPSGCLPPIAKVKNSEEESPRSLHGSPILASAPHKDHHHRFLPSRQGSSPPGPHGRKQMDSSGVCSSRQSTQAQSSSEHMQQLSTQDQGSLRVMTDNRASMYYKPSRRSDIPVLVCRSRRTLELVHNNTRFEGHLNRRHPFL